MINNAPINNSNIYSIYIYNIWLGQSRGIILFINSVSRCIVFIVHWEEKVDPSMIIEPISKITKWVMARRKIGGPKFFIRYTSGKNDALFEHPDVVKFMGGLVSQYRRIPHSEALASTEGDIRFAIFTLLEKAMASESEIGFDFDRLSNVLCDVVTAYNREPQEILLFRSPERVEMEYFYKEV